MLGAAAVLNVAVAAHSCGPGTWSGRKCSSSKLKTRRIGMKSSSSDSGIQQSKNPPAVVVLDIEGTTTPIAFVTEVLFPYAYNNVRNHLLSSFHHSETQSDIQLIRQQVNLDLEQGLPGATPLPPDNADGEEIVAAVEANVKAMISADRKVAALKELQGHIWRTGFANGQLRGQVFEDVPVALAQWQEAGTKTYIYSSGSREAQRLIFATTQYGDLRRYLCGFFDTSIGPKMDSKSYTQIFQFVGVDDASQITFATDVLAEATAAKQAGLEAVLLLRPGNKPLPSQHINFRTISSLLEL